MGLIAFITNIDQITMVTPFASQDTDNFSIWIYRMGAGRKHEIFRLNETVPFNPEQTPNASIGRNLVKSNLGGVIFGCKNSTIKECLLKQIFGMAINCDT